MNDLLLPHFKQGVGKMNNDNYGTYDARKYNSSCRTKLSIYRAQFFDEEIYIGFYKMSYTTNR